MPQMSETISWPVEFARVIACTRCSSDADGKLLRDKYENVPQPGYIGSRYCSRRVLFVGQNPGTPNRLETEDKPYTQALRNLREIPSEVAYANLMSVLEKFIPRWPVHGNYFPLLEAELVLEDIAYFNAVRCRTSDNARPGARVVATCLDAHFGRWLDHLSPSVVVFIGKWAADRASAQVHKRGIPFAFMNRQRSLVTFDRLENRKAVVQIVQANAAQPTVRAQA